MLGDFLSVFRGFNLFDSEMRIFLQLLIRVNTIISHSHSIHTGLT
jgi:hypothetical protein